MPVPSSIADLSTTPSSNSPAGSETPSSTDDYLRTLSAFIKQAYNAAQGGTLTWCGTSGGTANALTLTPSPAITAYAAGQVFRFKSGASANTGATTVAISGLAAIALQSNGAACVGGEILANKWYEILLTSATNAQLIGSYIHTTGNETIAGVKTFTSSPVVPADFKWQCIPIGGYHIVDDSLTGVDIPPTDNPLFRYIKLTAGLTGSGQYNEGCLTSESVSGSAPLVQATAVVNLTGSPMLGQTIDLLNTEERVLRAGTSAGAKLQDAFQGHRHSLTGVLIDSIGNVTAGGAVGGAGSKVTNDNSYTADSVGGTARAANETRAKSLTVTVYQRIL